MSHDAAMSRFVSLPSNVRQELRQLRTLQELPKARYASRIALTALPSGRGRKVTYSHVDLYKMVENVATIMRENGVRPNTVCAIAVPNSVEALVYFLAVVWIGAIVAPIDIKMPQETIEKVLIAVEAATLVSPLVDEDEQEDDQLFQTMKQISEKLGIIEWHITRTINEGVVLETHDKRAAEGAAWAGGASDFNSDDTQIAMLLAGVSGENQVALPLAHENIVTAVRMFVNAYNLHSDTTTILVRPWSSVEVIVQLLGTIYSGGHIVLPCGEMNADSSVQSMYKEYKVNWFSARTEFLKELATNSDVNAKENNLIFVHADGEDLDEEECERINQGLGTVVVQSYGTNESSGIVCCSVPENHRAGSRGNVCGECTIRIFDIKTHEYAEYGVDGLIGVTGTNVTTGYKRGNTDKITVVAEDGEPYILTGDIGRVDSDGFLYIKPRNEEASNTNTAIERVEIIEKEQAKQERLIRKAEAVAEEEKRKLEEAASSNCDNTALAVGVGVGATAATAVAMAATNNSTSSSAAYETASDKADTPTPTSSAAARSVSRTYSASVTTRVSSSAPSARTGGSDNRTSSASSRSSGYSGGSKSKKSGVSVKSGVKEGVNASVTEQDSEAHSSSGSSSGSSSTRSGKSKKSAKQCSISRNASSNKTGTTRKSEKEDNISRNASSARGAVIEGSGAKEGNISHSRSGSSSSAGSKSKSGKEGSVSRRSSKSKTVNEGSASRSNSGSGGGVVSRSVSRARSVMDGLVSKTVSFARSIETSGSSSGGGGGGSGARGGAPSSSSRSRLSRSTAKSGASGVVAEPEEAVEIVAVARALPLAVAKAGSTSESGYVPTRSASAARSVGVSSTLSGHVSGVLGGDYAAEVAGQILARLEAIEENQRRLEGEVVARHTEALTTLHGLLDAQVSMLETKAAETAAPKPAPSIPVDTQALTEALTCATQAAANSQRVADAALAAVAGEVSDGGGAEEDGDSNTVNKNINVQCDIVDRAMRQHPAVEVARAFGREHPEMGSEVYCAVKIKDGARVSEAWLTLHAQACLPAPWVPRKFYIREDLQKSTKREELAMDMNLERVPSKHGFARATHVSAPSWIPSLHQTS